MAEAGMAGLVGLAASQAVVASRAGLASRPVTWAASESSGRGAAAASGRPAVVGVVPAGVAMLLGLWQISRRSFTQDEAATLSAVRRPLGAMITLLGHIDAVHGCYYLLMHFLVMAGTSEVVVRLPTVLAVAAAAWLTAALGTRLAGWRAGLAAGLVFAVSPLATEYAQDARPFAVITALAVLATYRLVIFAETGTRADAAWYGLAVACCGLMDIFGLPIVVAHCVTLAGHQVWRSRLRRFATAAAVAVLAVSPLGWLTVTEVNQVDWERRPGPAVVAALLAALIVAGLVMVVAVSCQGRRPGAAAGPATPGPVSLAWVSGPWLIVPAATLLAVSQVRLASAPGAPVAGAGIWEPRYLLFCVPAAGLLAVAAMSLLGKKATAAAMVAAVLAVAAWQSLDRPAISTDDLRAVSALLERQALPGDAVVFPDVVKRLMKAAYPAAFTRIADPGLDTSPAARDSLYGSNVNPVVLRRRLADEQRIWVVTFPVHHAAGHYGSAARPWIFCLVRTWRFTLNLVALYARCVPRDR